MAKTIDVLGTGCAKCKMQYETVLQAVAELGLDAEVNKVEDIAQIVAAGVMMTPAIRIDGTVVASGKLYDLAAVKALLEA
ncbi:MAG: thioredoxin family protein [Phycisphaerales bacterium]|jgi:small redox-active disulfide protein 2|nr:thioredoxin family protein [Phycisphaerales bacterium]MBT7170637.1 thioredoxin family protein [Phycisphaerales bacterium]